mmetsp:Transcript_14686/g.26027  ORF Transcript_14686/g.26027 Transcript_14686/m.26027 type:complete len:273 (-) Transcript_14686:1296-2114(-)
MSSAASSISKAASSSSRSCTSSASGNFASSSSGDTSSSSGEAVGPALTASSPSAGRSGSTGGRFSLLRAWTAKFLRHAGRLPLEGVVLVKAWGESTRSSSASSSSMSTTSFSSSFFVDFSSSILPVSSSLPSLGRSASTAFVAGSAALAASDLETVTSSTSAPSSPSSSSSKSAAITPRCKRALFPGAGGGAARLVLAGRAWATAAIAAFLRMAGWRSLGMPLSSFFFSSCDLRFLSISWCPFSKEFRMRLTASLIHWRSALKFIPHMSMSW